MADRIGPQNLNPAAQATNEQIRQMREHAPKAENKPGIDFGGLVNGAVQIGAGALGRALGVAGLGGAGGAGGAIGGALGGGGGDPSYQALIQQQMQLQKESLVFQGQSNLLKTEHETRMNTVRNMRA